MTRLSLNPTADVLFLTFCDCWTYFCSAQQTPPPFIKILCTCLIANLNPTFLFSLFIALPFHPLHLDHDHPASLQQVQRCIHSYHSHHCHCKHVQQYIISPLKSGNPGSSDYANYFALSVNFLLRTRKISNLHCVLSKHCQFSTNFISSNFNQVDNIGVTPDYQLPMLMINNLTINMTIHHHHETSWISSWPWSWNWPMQWSGTQQQYLSYYQLPMLVSLDPFSSPFVSPWRGIFIVITITIIINRHNLPDPPSPLRQQLSSFDSPPLCHPSSFAWPCLYW